MGQLALLPFLLLRFFFSFDIFLYLRFFSSCVVFYSAGSLLKRGTPRHSVQATVYFSRVATSLTPLCCRLSLARLTSHTLLLYCYCIVTVLLLYCYCIVTVLLLYCYCITAMLYCCCIAAVLLLYCYYIATLFISLYILYLIPHVRFITFFINRFIHFTFCRRLCLAWLSPAGEFLTAITLHCAYLGFAATMIILS